MFTKLFTMAAAPLALSAQSTPQAAVFEAAWPAQIHRDLVRLGEVEWELRRNAVLLCESRAAGIGIVVDDLDAYREDQRDFVSMVTGLAEVPQVIAVMAGGPAERAGLREGDGILSVNGMNVAELAKAYGDETLSDAVMDRIGATGQGRMLRVEILRDGHRFVMDLEPERVCAPRFILKIDGKIDAYSDGDNVAVSTGAIRFAANQDELALIAGHELAHTIVHKGRKSGLFSGRKLEDEADALGAQLADCGGYDLARSLSFWERFAKKDWAGFLRLPTHRGSKARGERLRKMLPSLSCPVNE